MFTAMSDAAVSRAFLEAGASAFVSKMRAEDLLCRLSSECVLTEPEGDRANLGGSSSSETLFARNEHRLPRR